MKHADPDWSEEHQRNSKLKPDEFLKPLGSAEEVLKQLQLVLDTVKHSKCETDLATAHNALTIKTWVEDHKELADALCKDCRTVWMPKGCIAFPIGVDLSPVVDQLKLKDDEITTTIDGYEITLHYI